MTTTASSATTLRWQSVFFVMCFSFSLPQPSVAQASEPMSIDQRVACKLAIAADRLERQDWPESNPGPKPSLKEMFPADMARARVEDDLRKENALRELYGIAVDRETVQQELDRIASNTKSPERLNHLYMRLGADPTAMAECLVRPVLADRLLRQAYAADESMHAGTRRALEQTLEETGDTNKPDGLNRFVRRYIEGTDNSPPLDRDIQLDTAQWNEKRLALATQAARGNIVDDEIGFVHETLLAASPGVLTVQVDTAEKVSFGKWWLNNADSWNTDAVLHSLNGLSFDPKKSPNDSKNTQKAMGGSWSPTSLLNAPTARGSHVSLWTGAELIIWGGKDDDFINNEGGKYDPVTDVWTTTTETNAPTPRFVHSAVWTGSEMIVWGGHRTSSGTNTGGRYNPISDTWIAITGGSARYGHSAIWTGKEMLIWGGRSSYCLGTGHIYSPATNVWKAISDLGAPSPRCSNSASLTIDNRMLIWGGEIGFGETYFNTGGIYDPASDTWLETALLVAPIARGSHSAVADSTGGVLIWGGNSDGFPSVRNDGARFDPSTNQWSMIPDVDNFAERFVHNAISTGHSMIVWGGWTGGMYLSTGAEYDFAKQAWTLIPPSEFTPQARAGHTLEWTGESMIIWGGGGGSPSHLYLNTGAVFTPTITVTPTAGIGGSVEPGSPQVVNIGSVLEFTVLPQPGFAIDGVVGCDGNLVGKVYTTGPIVTDCNVEATFVASDEIFTLTYTAGPYGSVNGQAVVQEDMIAGGSGAAVNATPSPGYIFVQWSDGSTDNPRIDANIIGDVDVTAQFEFIDGIFSNGFGFSDESQ